MGHGPWTYDAVHVLALTIDNAKSLEPQKIREAILSVNVHGISAWANEETRSSAAAFADPLQGW